MADEQSRDDVGTLTYGDRTWKVESAPVVVDTHDGLDLVEVWVERGEDVGESG
ncbi:hypothetical protein [Streptomyces sp. NBC_00076]|uniref:hypothetical protein n=1 Tax=Streptomyces sp. NBC_00076 TaxID=2975642 RepID=UPI0032561CAC